MNGINRHSNISPTSNPGRGQSVETSRTIPWQCTTTRAIDAVQRQDKKVVVIREGWRTVLKGFPAKGWTEATAAVVCWKKAKVQERDGLHH